MSSPVWIGMEDCRHYRGVKMITGRVCCGGVRTDRVKLGCVVHKNIYAKDCREQLCGYYEKGESECPKKE